MSEDKPEVKWDKLPHDPVSFFDLEEGFNRRDLKKSYNKLLKLFKPEKYPDEFKKIRAAYETLEENLAYGRNMPSQQIIVDIHSGENETQDSWEEIIQKRPNDLSTLINNPDVSYPEKFIYGAFVEEAKHGEIAFINTIMEGLKTYPDEYRLKSILERFIKEDLETSTDDLLNILDLNLKQSFFQLSEPLWFRYFEANGFESFLEKFKGCKHFKAYFDPVEITIFYIRLCKKFFFRLSNSFLAEHISTAEEYFEQLPYDTREDLDFVLSLLDYAEMKEKFLSSKKPYRLLLHNFIQNWCEDDVSQAQANALRFLSNENHKAAISSFKITDSEFYPVLRIFNSIVDTVKFESDFTEEEYEDEEKNKKVKDLLLYLQAKTSNSSVGKLRNLAYIVFFAYHIVIAAIPSVIIEYGDYHPENAFYKWLILIGVFIGAGMIYIRIIDRFPQISLAQIVDFADKFAYKKCWREIMVDFIQDTGISDSEFANTSSNMKDKGDISFDSDIIECMQDDIGMQIFATAIQFQ